MAWGHRRVPLELAQRLGESDGVLLWYFVELNVTAELLKRYVF